MKQRCDDSLYLTGILCLFHIAFTAYCFSVYGQPGQWKVYHVANSSIPDNIVNAVYLDTSGIVWVGTNQGVVCFDGKKWVNYSISSRMQSAVVTALAMDAEGNLWVGTKENGVAQLSINFILSPKEQNMNSWVFYRPRNSPIPAYHIRTLVVDRQQNIWIGTDLGLVRYGSLSWGSDSEDEDATLSRADVSAGRKWTLYDVSTSGLPLNKIRAILPDPYGNLWAGTFGGGLVKYDGKFWTPYTIQNTPLPDNYIVSLAMDGKGYLWVGTYSGGLVKFEGAHLPGDSKDWKIFKTSNSAIPDDLVTAIAIDSDNLIWSGSFNSGLTSFDGNRFVSYSLNNKVPSYTVSSLSIDKKGNKWMGTPNGLAMFNEKTVK